MPYFMQIMNLFYKINNKLILLKLLKKIIFNALYSHIFIKKKYSKIFTILEQVYVHRTKDKNG